MAEKSSLPPRWREIPGSVWALGLVSLFMDSFLRDDPCAAAALSCRRARRLHAHRRHDRGHGRSHRLVTKVFSGVLSDYLRERKWLTALGYGLAAASKPIFPLAPDVAWVAAARFIDRVGKGIRGAPRDALIADLTPASLRGTAYGLRQSLDTVGAVLGPALAIAFMALLADNFTHVFWIAVIPAFISVAIIVLFVREPKRAAGARPVRSPLSRAEFERLERRLLAGGRRRRRCSRWRASAKPSCCLRAQSVGLHLDLCAGGDGGDERGLCALLLAGRRASRTGSAAIGCSSPASRC